MLERNREDSQYRRPSGGGKVEWDGARETGRVEKGLDHPFIGQHYSTLHTQHYFAPSIAVTWL